MSRHIIVDPITRLEGHGKIDVILKDNGEVDHAYFQVPELRGFEKFAEGRPAEDMPQITSRICGVCPMAHHMASTKALDDLYKVEPTPAGKAIREFIYNSFMFEDHALHFYFLGGPDFVVGPTAPKALRNVVGVIDKVGVEVGKKVIAMRREVRDFISLISGKVIHPAFGLPGGVSRAVKPEEQQRAIAISKQAVEFAEFTLGVFNDIVLKNKQYVDLITSPGYTHKTYYMGLVDAKNKVNFYDGMLRVVGPDGKEHSKFRTQDYLKHVSEHVEPWSYIKFCYLKNVGWKGFEEGPESGVYAVAPLARLNASDGMPTPKAQAAHDQFYNTLGVKPVHHTLAYHWARVVELISAAEMMLELAQSPQFVDPNIRNIPTQTPTEGVGVVEAPRGTLFHHFVTDPNGVITKANLIVATQNNAARIAMSVDRAAKAVIKGGKADDGIMNMVEMAFRAYDPCHGCATHALPGNMPLIVRLYDPQHRLVQEIRRDPAGA
ncbi:MAG TPA: Ni/Fe hydrogenase subunit alpha [Candidatus Saccharimonadales bacterium]|nr:Ni/Fe hydrogenase subunit alpha [Candidatus Saccharimonadales bacterium]